MMRWPWIAGLVIVAAAVGGATGSLVTLRIRDANDVQRGALVHLAAPDSIASFVPQPFCLAHYHFCIAQPETSHPIALYMYDPHPVFREWGCEVQWKPDQVYRPDSENPVVGVFADPCGGSLYDRTGRRLFGPTPRDLDTFAVEVTSEGTTVDTRRLICGERRVEGASRACSLVPLGE